MPIDPSSDRTRVCVLAAEPCSGVHARARALADELEAPYFPSGSPPRTEKEDLILAVTSDRLELRENTSRRSRPLFVDFTSGDLDRRRRTATAKNQPLARALGLRKGPSFVVDATAGFLGDTFHLACLGCRVVAIERSPVMAILAADGLARGLRSGLPNLVDILGRIRLIHADAKEFLSRPDLPFSPDAIFLDPMYDGVDRTALSRKELRIARELVGGDPDAGALFDIARKVARRRVVVKRHPSAPPLSEPVSVQFRARAVRYDVYLSPEPRSSV